MPSERDNNLSFSKHLFTPIIKIYKADGHVKIFERFFAKMSHFSHDFRTDFAGVFFKNYRIHVKVRCRKNWLEREGEELAESSI